ncbi:YqiA/YcfP family alpha/beta fold hydrolase [Croceibacter atlanticus]|uniref:YqiA/YcfP family alpha/beta fold hydrolase n=1 Tax=Croceibacter atlanticus TaxID=313588 RepID=UPI0024B8B5C2|nr:YqiA/YcfP family alpha/beta fold hydrolase [Croceibacter atlanticus]|tara:strand:+ start:1023 stop:1517 length:495 start_codon:yes stop_codon:yes gene_type:complete
MNILYLHGLDSSLSEEKLKILKPYGNIFYPPLKYRENPNCVDYILKLYKDLKFDAVIGSSMGGFIGFHISNKLNIPALLFNPALAYRSVQQDTEFFISSTPNFKYLVLGVNDDVIRPISTLDFISHQLETTTSFNLKIRQELEHRIPVNIFEEEVTHFFKIISI